jgi:hypothetical protein
MRKITLQILIVLAFAFSVLAQEEKPILIDEFERSILEELLGRIDSLASELSKRPDTKAVIRIYTGKEDDFALHYRYGSLIDAILKNRGKTPTDKYTIEYCTGNKSKQITQLYLLPPTVRLPKCEEVFEIPEKPVLFDKILFFYNDNKLMPLEDIYPDAISSTHGEYSLNAIEAFKDALNKFPESKIYILAYLGTNPEEKHRDKNGETIVKIKRKLDKKFVAKELLLNARNELIKNGIKPSQIETIEGGYLDDKRALEFWFVPKGGDIPKPKPTYFPKKNRQIKN